MVERGIIDDAIDKGKLEGKLEIALKMLKKGISIDDISDIIGLTKEQIERLLK